MARRSGNSKRIRIPLSEDEEKELERCEDKLGDSQYSFLEVGEALFTIKKRKLFRGMYATFEAYCERVWALPRHTAYIKRQTYEVYTHLKTAAEAEQNSPIDLPTHESQLRELLILGTPQLQWDAWRDAVTLRDTRQCPFTADVVREAVLSLREHRAFDFQRYLIADDSFPHIPWRLDIFSQQPDIPLPQAIFDPVTLIEGYGMPTLDNPPQSSQLVLVSPGYDLFNDNIPRRFLTALLRLLAHFNTYHFLLWTADVHQTHEFGLLPPNIERVIRIQTLNELNTFIDYRRRADSVIPCGVWLMPAGVSQIPDITITRILVGASKSSHNTEPADAAMLRALVINAIQRRISIHLTAAICEEFRLPVTPAAEKRLGQPFPTDEGPKPKINRNIVNLLHDANSLDRGEFKKRW